MQQKYPNPHPGPECFWHTWAETFGAPNVKWCEKTICFILSEPCNTLSNVAFFLATAVMISEYNRRSRLRAAAASSPADVLQTVPRAVLRLFPWCNFAMGLCSFIYHASNNFLTQSLDFVGMFFVTSCVIATALWRHRQLEHAVALGKRLKEDSAARQETIKRIAIFSGLQCLPLYPLYVNFIPFQSIIFINILMIIGIELVYISPLEEKLAEKALQEKWAPMKQIAESVTSKKDFYLSLFFMTIAGVCSLCDVKRILCVPDQHLVHGHALWHLLSAVGMFYVWRHLSRRAGI